jgi:N-acetylated-alpha-linked acidic dipeptidase
MAHIQDPSGKGTVYEVWRKQARVADSVQPPMGDPGGGSDYAGFYNHIGVPMAEWGFGGAGGVYHSLYDSYHWMATFGDTSYQYHAAAAKVGAMMMWRLANAEILPYDYQEYASTMKKYLPPMDSALKKKGWYQGDTALSAAIARLGAAATAFAAARDAQLARGPVSKGMAGKTNAALMRVERALLRPEGLRTRPWFRNLIYAADEDNGYADMVFPSVGEAMRTGDKALTMREIADLASRFDAAAQAVNEATAALK